MADLDLSRDGLLEILDTIDEGIHAVNLAGETTLYNRAAGRLDGLRPEDVLGKHLLQSFPSLENGTSTLLHVLKTGRPIYNRPQTYTNYLGVKVHTVNTSLPILSEGHLVGALEIAKDLTQVKRLSEQVLELQAQVAVSTGRRSASRSGPSSRSGTGGRDGALGPGGTGRASNAANSADSVTQAVYRFSHLLTEYPPLIEVKRRADKASQTTSPILIYGETGTGKELLVQAIHNAGPRHQDPFLALNCAALPASLLEGILFGTVRGSFTGAEDRAGLFELANGGTLFLDEIQSMPLDLQAKLLRVLQEGELMRVGDLRVRRVDVRVMTATNVAPEEAVRQGQLRNDLYFRINVVRFDLPPLRDRRCDLALLTEHFIGKLNGRFGSRVRGVTDAVMALFSVYPWPGNVRELENALEAAMNLVEDGWIDIDSLPIHLRNYATKQGLWQHGQDASDEAERADQTDWIDRTDGDLSRSAETRAGTPNPNRIGSDKLDPDKLNADKVDPDRLNADKPDPGVPDTVRTSHADNSAQSVERATIYAGNSAHSPWVDALEQVGLPDFWHGLEEERPPALGWRELQSAFERIILTHALNSSGGNVKQASEFLRIPRQTLQYRMKQLHIGS